MNSQLQAILHTIQNTAHLSEPEKESLIKSIQEADKIQTLIQFNLDRLEGDKNALAAMLEENIEDLQKKSKAIEAQNRELEIEAALERVRAVAMGMTQPKDMLDVCKTISEQLALLNVKEIRNVQTAIFYENKGTYINYEYYAKHDKLLITEVEYINHPMSKVFANQMLSGPEGFFTHNLAANELKNWYAFQKTTNQFVDTYLETAPSLNYYWYSLGPVALGLSTYVPVSEDEMNLFRRFRNVFDLAYRRFLDIEKAQAQAREAKIEAALERTRTQSMIMQHSKELDDTLRVFHEQVLLLGINSAFSFLWLPDEDKDRHIFWAAWAENLPTGQPNKDSSTVFKSKAINYPLDRNEPATAQCLVDWKSDESVHSYYVPSDSVENYFAVWKELIDGVEKLKPEYFQDGLYYIEAFMKYGCFGVMTKSPLPEEEKQILGRFAIEFERAYTRFLDLQKAEAQAREAKIEAALEKVRSRTMGMQKSEELKEVIQVVYEQFVHLNIYIEHTGFIIDYKARDDMHIWLADQHEVPFQVTIPYFDCAHWNSFNEAKEKGKDFFANHLSFEEKNRFYQDLFKLIPGLPEEAKEYYFNCPGLAISTVLLENVGLYIENFSGIPYSDEENKTLMRFGNVFQQTYTRFLDLQKAEAQAREAKIEAALEKVRSRSLAMHKSEELQQVVNVVFEKLMELDILLDTVCINIFIEDSKDLNLWIAAPDQSYAASFHVPYIDNPLHTDIFNAKSQGVNFFAKVYSFEEKNSYHQFAFEYSDFRYVPENKKKLILESKVCCRSAAITKNAVLYIHRYLENPFSEKENEIIKRFANVFEQAYVRFMDLQKAEAQAREAEIELGLERVRAKTMAMQHQNDLLDVTDLLAEQLIHLGFDLEIVNFSNSLSYGDWDLWVTSPTSETARATDRIVIPWIDHPYFKKTRIGLDNFKKGIDLNVAVFNKEDKDSFLDHIFSNSILKDLPGESKTYLYNKPGFTFSAIFLKETWVSICKYDTRPFTDEQHAILRRFANAFGQAYTRFLDLQKAEAQAREAEIELALERVRARTMAMQKSDELKEVIATVFEKLQDVGVVMHQRTALIIEFEKESQDFTQWIATSNKEAIGYKTPYTDHPVLSDFFNARLNRIPFFQKKYTALERNTLFKHFFEHRGTVLTDAEKEVIFEGEHYALSSAFENNSAIAIASFSEGLLSEKESEILIRFAKVFDQSYTRFLDLQKAEAQAREAQIEAALERVRSRSMGMQKSEELKEVIQIVFEQLRQLNFNIDSAHFNLNFKESNDYNLWSAAPGQPYPVKTYIPYFNHPVFIKAREAKENGLDFFTESYTQEEKNAFFEHLFKHTPAISEERRKYILSGPGVAASTVLMNTISLWIMNYAGTPYSEVENAILKRFGKIFEQSYTRFLDLQKAEAQAREAQIEAAMERVRSRTMAMQKSYELTETSFLLFQQLKELGETAAQLSIGIIKEEEGFVEFSATFHGSPTPQMYNVPVDEPFVMKKILEAWRAKQKSLLLELKGEELKAYNNWRNSFLENKIIFSEERWIINIIFFSKGFLSFSSDQPRPKETLQLLEKFAGVFDLTYTRFLDLKQAEAQAREAQIEAALERVRAKAIAMHNSNDLSSTASMVFTELRKLGINPIRCGVGLQYKESRKAQLYSAMSSADGDSLALVGWIMLSGHPLLEKIYDKWVKNEDYFFELSGEQLRSYYEQLSSGLSVPSVPDWKSGEKQYGHFLAFSMGCLYAWSATPYNDGEINILKRFATIIDLTFIRYMELQKSEANAREAVRQAALDRIRADIASMRTVNDLNRIIPLIWNELTILGLPFIRCGVFIMDDALQVIHTYLSTPDGKAITAFHLPYTTPGNIQKVLSHWCTGKKYIDHWDKTAFTQFAQTLAIQGALSSAEEYLKTIPHEGFYLHFLPFLQGMLYVGNTMQLNEDEIKLIQSVADAFSTAYARYEDFNKLEAAKKQIEKTLIDLRQAQQQLVQSEKMASLGELTAGIAHEIQNPLNFVNNFSEVNTELIEELKGERSKVKVERNEELQDEILNDIQQNLEKIIHHGKRADAIVKGMLQHSRVSMGQKESTDINVLADEYLRLSYHGMRAKDKSFNATLQTDFDSSIGKINVVPQDIGRLLLNLFNNAFYAVSERRRAEGVGHEPTVSVCTKKIDGKVEIHVKDNGTGIPQKVVDKIFQPFFTTKPTGKGTGLGLSLSYDIIKAHGGEIRVETKEGEGSEFVIHLCLE